MKQKKAAMDAFKSAKIMRAKQQNPTGGT